MKQVLLSGYYGFNNIGDEAVLGGILAGMREQMPEVQPVVLSANPDRTTQLHGVPAIPRMSRTAIGTALQHTDLFVSGGGSLLQDVTSWRSPLYYLWVIREAQRAGVPTMMLGQGVGPLHNPIIRRLTRGVLNHLSAITVRDAASADFLRALGVTRPPIEVTADPSLLLAPDASERLAAWWNKHLPANRPVIGAALRPWRSKTSEASYTATADALAAMARETGALILFIPMQHEVDLPVSEEMAGWTLAESRVLDLPLTPREMLAAIGRCDYMLAMRLHALIFAVHQGTPALGLSYDPKVRDFSQAAGLPVPLAWEDLTGDPLTAALRAEWEQRDARRETISAQAAHLTERARVNITRMQELIAPMA